MDAGALLRKARTRAGLSQSDLARRAGVPQSVVSEYEAGKREPALPTLARLVAGTGHQLTLGLSGPTRPCEACRTRRWADGCASIAGRCSRR